jgi:hypothetical protein
MDPGFIGRGDGVFRCEVSPAQWKGLHFVTILSRTTCRHMQAQEESDRGNHRIPGCRTNR